MIEVKQRKKCGSCRAFSPVSKRCGIGYSTETIMSGFGIVLDCKPLEPCPKPLTVSEYLDAYKNYNKSIIRVR